MVDPPAKNPEDDPRCHLFGPTAIIVQILMGVLVLGSLVYKRQREFPRRKWNIWIYDVSKQVIGQAMLHASNVFVSWAIGKRTLANPCVSYFLNILLDTTLGVLMIYGMLQLFTRLLTEKAHLTGLKSGVYGDPPSPMWWLKQLGVYLFVLFLMKTSVIALIEIFPFLMTFGSWLLSWSNSRNAVQVIFVMGIFPIAMNIVQFWLIDSIVKFKSTFVEVSSPRSHEDRNPLVDDYDEDNDNDSGRYENDIEGNSPHSRTSYSVPPSASSKTFTDRARITHNDDGPASTPTSSSSRTIMPRRRSPPPDPAPSYTPSSSYGSTGVLDDDEHAKWGREFDAEGDADTGAGMSTSPGKARSRSPADLKKSRLESWNMPVLSPSSR
ncbi:hypothetical protein DL93DRAFT_2138394 [Clavulina sp. PMI_390]|nr:hypothetical protein DL93DRAFT_2138394 [Clavulina sp. PMI_390]